MTRHEMREMAIKLIFSEMVFKNDAITTGEKVNGLDNAQNLSLEEFAHIVKILDLFIEKQTELEEMVKAMSKDFELSRIYKVDLSILFLAIIEIKFIGELAPAIVINEALELAREYSTEKSPKFINGILAELVKEIK